MTVSNYSTTANNNTSVNGINISEGMSPSDVNNATEKYFKDVRSVWNDKEWFLLGDGDGKQHLREPLLPVLQLRLTLHQHTMLIVE